MTESEQNFCLSPLPSPRNVDETSAISQISAIPACSSSIELINYSNTEDYQRHLLNEKISTAEKQGLWVFRLWQLLTIVNIVIVISIFLIFLWLLFIIGPLAPYRTYGQSCRTLSCNRAHGLVCDSSSMCSCPTSTSYWSWKDTGCRHCSTGWSMINGKCIFVSNFHLNWTRALSYCRSSNAQLLTLSKPRLYPRISLSQLNSIFSSNTNYFLGFSEQPINSGNWSWVDGSKLDSSSLNLFCTNSSINELDVIFLTRMNCGIYRMDQCLTRSLCQRADIPFACEKI